jgi:RimJ/RimL family protein N-acetyltransferase
MAILLLEEIGELREHGVHLQDGPLVLRPMTEDDWDILLRWNNDPEVLYYAEGDDVTSRALEEVQATYRGVSRMAFTFIAELNGNPIGECWLQRMNLPGILERYPDEMDLRRIDLAIGEKDLWGRGWGTRIIALLVRFGFEQCGADAIFGCGVADYNPRSRRAFEKNGFVVDRVVPEEPGRKAQECYDLVLTRREHRGQEAADGQDSTQT